VGRRVGATAGLGGPRRPAVVGVVVLRQLAMEIGMDKLTRMAGSAPAHAALCRT
jgi:hypothetical protein